MIADRFFRGALSQYFAQLGSLGKPDWPPICYCVTYKWQMGYTVM